MITSAPPIHPIREDVDGLIARLTRISALRVQIGAIADDLHGHDHSATLAAALATLERDLTLTARSAGRIHERLIEGSSA